MIDYVLLGLIGFSFIFVGLSTVFLFKEKEFEDERLGNSVFALFVGMVCLSLFLFVKFMEKFLIMFFSVDISYYANLAELVGVSLMIVFFLVGMILMREIK